MDAIHKERMRVVEALVGAGLAKTFSEAIRKVREGAVYLKGNRVNNPDLDCLEGDQIRIANRESLAQYPHTK